MPADSSSLLLCPQKADSGSFHSSSDSCISSMSSSCHKLLTAAPKYWRFWRFYGADSCVSNCGRLCRSMYSLVLPSSFA